MPSRRCTELTPDAFRRRILELEQRFLGVHALRACAVDARTKQNLQEVALLAKNGSGKTMIADMLALTCLNIASLLDQPDGVVAPPPPPSSRLLAEALQQHESVEAALAAGVGLRLEVNPEPHLDETHLQNAHGCYEGYYRNDRRYFNPQEYSLLLPIGERTGSTTQVKFTISNDEVVACRITPNTTADFKGMVDYCLENMINCISDDREEQDTLQDPWFRRFKDLLILLSGCNVEERCRSCGVSLYEVLKIITEEHERGSLLWPELSELGNALETVVCQGAQQDLSSDLKYVKLAVADPVKTLLDRQECAWTHALQCLTSKLPGIDTERTLQGILVKQVDITAPLPTFGNLKIVDLPGLDDTRPLVNFNIAQALSASKHVMLVTHKNLSTDAQVVTYLNYLQYSSTWMTRQLVSSEATSGRLLIVHYPEGVDTLKLKDLWGQRLEREAASNWEFSKDEMRRNMVAATTRAGFTAEDQEATIENFIQQRIICVTVHPATFCSLGLEPAADVCAALLSRPVNANLPAHFTQQQVVSLLMKKTGMDTLLEALVRLNRTQDRQHLDMLKTSIERTRTALLERVDLEEGDAKVLERWRDTPRLISSVIENMISGQAADLNYVKLIMKDKLVNWVKEHVLDEYNKLTSPAGAQDIAAYALELINGVQPPLSMNRLRQLCKSKRYPVTVLGKCYLALGDQLIDKLKGSALQPIRDRGERLLLDIHRDAASEIARVLIASLTVSFRNHPGLLAFLTSEPMWSRQLVARIEEELVRAAQCGWVEGVCYNDPIKDLIMDKLSAELRGVNEANNGRCAKAVFLTKIQNGIVEAMLKVQQELPSLLEAQLVGYLRDDVFTPLFEQVKSTRHMIARLEAGLDMLGRRLELYRKRSQAPSLWRCLRRFLCAAQPMSRQMSDAAENTDVNDDEGEPHNSNPIDALLFNLTEISQDLERALAVHEPTVDELLHQLGNSLALNALRRARTVQDNMLPSIYLKGVAMPGVVKMQYPAIVDVHGFRVYDEKYVKPSEYWEDTLSGLQEMFKMLARHGIYWKGHVPPFDGKSAMAAAHLVMQDRPVSDATLASLMDRAAEALANDQETLLEGLELSSIQETKSMYLAKLTNGQRWTGLLELNGLALSLGVNFVVVTSTLDVATQNGRRMAYWIRGKDGSVPPIDGRLFLEGYPLAMVMRKAENEPRPWFLPLFLDKHKTAEMLDRGSAPYVARQLGEAPAWGSEEEARLILNHMAAVALHRNGHPPPAKKLAG